MSLFDRLWLLVSQALNCLWFSGDPDESLSARSWRLRSDPYWERMRQRIDDRLGTDHCKRVWELQHARELARNPQT